MSTNHKRKDQAMETVFNLVYEDYREAETVDVNLLGVPIEVETFKDRTQAEKRLFERLKADMKEAHGNLYTLYSIPKELLTWEGCEKDEVSNTFSLWQTETLRFSRGTIYKNEVK